MMINKFAISEGERDYILNLHRKLLTEQNVTGLTVTGSADKSPIENNAMGNLGLPVPKYPKSSYLVTKEGFTQSIPKPDNTVLSLFKEVNDGQGIRDYIKFTYNNGGSQILDGTGSKNFTTAGMVSITAAKNGLLALSRAIRQCNGKYPSEIQITLQGTRTSSSVEYDAKKINNIIPELTTISYILAAQIIPADKLNTINPTYFFKDKVQGYVTDPINNIEMIIKNMYRKFIPDNLLSEYETTYKPVINYDIISTLKTNGVANINKSIEPYNQFIVSIRNQYITSVTKFIEKYFPESAQEKINLLHPSMIPVNRNIVYYYNQQFTTHTPGKTLSNLPPTLVAPSTDYKIGK